MEIWNNCITLIEDYFLAHGANIDFRDTLQSDLHDASHARGGHHFYVETDAADKHILAELALNVKRISLSRPT